VSAGRLLRYAFRRLLSVHLRYGLHARQVTHVTLYIEGCDGFVTSTAAPKSERLRIPGTHTFQYAPKVRGYLEAKGSAFFYKNFVAIMCRAIPLV
jgi:hypothetical protein